MTRIEREHLVEQYLQGMMDFSEEENFFIQVALDDELRRTLKSYRIVDDAIRKEREAGAHGHAGARRLVAGMLVFSPENEPALSSPFQQGEPIPDNAENATGQTPNRSRRIVAAFGIVALLLFGWMAIDQSSDQSNDRTVEQTAAPASVRNSNPNVVGKNNVLRATQSAQPSNSVSSLRDDPPLPKKGLTPRQETQKRATTPPLQIDSTLKAAPRQDSVTLPIELDFGESLEK